ncbi:cell agglutination protein Mam3 [Rhodotorula toruloides]
MVLAASGPPQDRIDAQKVFSLLSHGRHFVLVCLLLSNVIVNETLPVFLDSLIGGGGILAIVISSAAIVIFGEVLPQALCAQYGLRVGAKCVGFVRVLMYLESPVCYPAAKVLDWLLGSHTTHLYRREELKTLVHLHAGGKVLREDEGELVERVLELAERRVGEAVRRTKEVFAVSDGLRICDVDLKQLLIRRQHFLPVRRSKTAFGASEENKEEPFVGYLRIGELIEVQSRPNDLVRSLALRPLVQVVPNTSVIDCIAFLRREDPEAVLLVSNSAFDGADALGFAVLHDLLKAILHDEPDEARDLTVSLGASARAALARPPRASASIGLSRFVSGIVDRHFTHRASSSQLSFRLDSSDEESNPFSRSRTASASYRPLASSPHSHHRTTSSVSRSPVVPAPRKTGWDGRGGGFKFPTPGGSPVGEEVDTFALGDVDDEEARDDSGFGDGEEVGGKGGELDPLGIEGGRRVR